MRRMIVAPGKPGTPQSSTASGERRRVLALLVQAAEDVFWSCEEGVVAQEAAMQEMEQILKANPINWLA